MTEIDSIASDLGVWILLLTAGPFVIGSILGMLWIGALWCLEPIFRRRLF